jgi:small-conductance mechanosensitive channel
MTTMQQIVKSLDPHQLSGALIIAAALVIIGLVLSKLMHGLLREIIVHDKSERVDQITVSFLSHLAILITWIFLITLYAHLIPALHKLGAALLAGVGLMSIIVGFAAQSTLGNLVAGISLVLYKPFRRGDRLQVLAPTKEECEVGCVEDITLGFTVLRTDDGRQIIIANGTMIQQTFIKLTATGGAGAR